MRKYKSALFLFCLLIAAVPVVRADRYIVTPHDKRMPNWADDFYAPPAAEDFRTITDGLWTSGSTWNKGTAPGPNSRAIISHDVLINASNAVAETVAVVSGGKLWFDPDQDTKLTVVTLQIHHGGTLQIGTVDTPVSPNVKAEIVFSDRPIDTGVDPFQYGHGLISFGKVVMHGAPLNETFVRLSAEVAAGDSTLSLATAVSGWRVGDHIFLPGTDQVSHARAGDPVYVPKYEERIITSVGGTSISLNQPAQFAHKGARDPDGTIAFLPHVANLTRNVVIRAANPLGTRGHVMFTERAEIDVRYVEVRDMGRTTVMPIDATTEDASGTILHVGSNQFGRYGGFHCHFLYGPLPADSSGFQFKIIGCSMTQTVVMDDEKAIKWYLTAHASSYGLFKGNVGYGAGGAALMLEAGNERENVIQGNLFAVIRYRGGFPPSPVDFPVTPNNGVSADCYWAQNTLNKFIGNYAYDAAVGFDYMAGGNSGGVRLGRYPGADVFGPDTDVFLPHEAEIKSGYFVDNEAVSCDIALAPWFINMGHNGSSNAPNPDAKESYFERFTAWHCRQGIFSYKNHQLTFDRYIARGDWKFPGNWGMRAWVYTDYQCDNCTVTRADIRGCAIGVTPNDTTATPGAYFKIIDSYLYNYHNIMVPGIWSCCMHDYLYGRNTIIQNTRFDLLPKHGGWDTNPANIINSTGGGTNVVQHDKVVVFGYDGNPNDNFEVFSVGSRPTDVTPKSRMTLEESGSPLFAAPEAGLTNAQNWAKYQLDQEPSGRYVANLRTDPNKMGIAIKGRIAPCQTASCDELKRTGIEGYVAPLDEKSLIVSKPKQGSLIVGHSIDAEFLRLNDANNTTSARLTLDGGAPVTLPGSESNHTFEDVPFGAHTLLVELLDENDELIPNTGINVSFENAETGSADPDDPGSDPTNAAPTVNAGPDQSISLTQTAQLSGVATDDGKPAPPRLITTWSKVSGPGSVAFQNASSLNTGAHFGAMGDYRIRLTGSDGSASSSDEMRVAVTVPAGQNGTDYVLRDQRSVGGQPIEFRYTLSQSGQVVLKLFTAQGDLVKVLVDEYQLAGAHSVLWRLENGQGSRVRSQLLRGEFSGPGGRKRVKVAIVN